MVLSRVYQIQRDRHGGKWGLKNFFYKGDLDDRPYVEVGSGWPFQVQNSLALPRRVGKERYGSEEHHSVEMDGDGTQ